MPCRFFRLYTALLAITVCLPLFSAERIVDLTAPDGVTLKATFFSAAKPGPGVLLLHQCNRQRKVWDDLARQLSATGINVLTFDMRGFGESGDDRFDKAPPKARAAQFAKWPGDIDVAFKYLQSQPGVNRDVIGVGGASCGVDNSVQAAIRHPEVKSLVLLSGPTNLAGRNFLRNDRTIPVFFAFADDDEFKPTLIDMPWLYSVTANPSKEMAHYQTGGHGADIFPVHPDLPSKIVQWWVTTLVKTPGHASVPKETYPIPKQARILAVLDEPGGALTIAEQLADARKRDANVTLFPEDRVNIMGYEHIQAGDTKTAIEILKLNADAYPNSANAYDSLGDAYLAAGQKDLARQNARKALELLASDTTIDAQRRELIKQSAEKKLLPDGE